MHKIESEAVVEDLKKLERVLSEWEPKTATLMEANPANVTVDAGPDPYAAELNSQRQRLAAVCIYTTLARMTQVGARNALDKSVGYRLALLNVSNAYLLTFRMQSAAGIEGTRV